MEGLIKSTCTDWQENFSPREAKNRRNTLCISRFFNEAGRKIFRQGGRGDLFRASLYFQDFGKELPCLVTRDKDHGRIEKREYRLLPDLSWLPECSEWAGLKAVGSVCSTVTSGGTTSTDTRFFITPLTNINRFSYAVRKHWAIENQLHWSLGVIFDEDSSRARKDLSPLNLNILRKTALALCKHADFGRKFSMQKKRFAATLNPDRFLDILFAKL